MGVVGCHMSPAASADVVAIQPRESASCGACRLQTSSLAMRSVQRWPTKRDGVIQHNLPCMEGQWRGMLTTHLHLGG